MPPPPPHIHQTLHQARPPLAISTRVLLLDPICDTKSHSLCSWIPDVTRPHSQRDDKDLIRRGRCADMIAISYRTCSNAVWPPTATKLVRKQDLAFAANAQARKTAPTDDAWPAGVGGVVASKNKVIDVLAAIRQPTPRVRVLDPCHKRRMHYA